MCERCELLTRIVPEERHLAELLRVPVQPWYYECILGCRPPGAGCYTASPEGILKGQSTE